MDVYGRYNMIYSPVICYIAIETGPFIDDLLIKNGDFPWFSIVMLVYQSVTNSYSWGDTKAISQVYAFVEWGARC